MKSFKWRKLGIVSGLSLVLLFTGCGTNEGKDGQVTADESVSEQMNYTITGLEPGAGQTETNEKAIEVYDSLQGWEQDLSSTGAMLSALDEAIDKEEPIIITAWSPHYMFAKWDIKYLDDPEGVYGEAESVVTIVRKGLKEDLSEAYTILDRIQFDLADVEQGLLEAQEKEFEEVTEKWVGENQDLVTEWTDGVDDVDNTPIEIVTTPWDDALFSANVAKVVLEKQGYDVTLTPVDPAVLFEAVATGEADASLSPWIPATHGEFYDAYEGEFEDLGANLEGAKIGLAVPSYMDIDSLSDLEPKK